MVMMLTSPLIPPKEYRMKKTSLIAAAGVATLAIPALAQMHGGQVLATTNGDLTSIGMTLALVAHHDAAR